MYIYLALFVLTGIIAFWHMNAHMRVKPILFFPFMIGVGMFVGISDMLGGYDRYIYSEVYTSLAEDMASGNIAFNETYLRLFGKEPIYGLINIFIGLLTPNRYVFIFVYTLLLYVIYSICFYRFTEQPFFALLVFLGLMFFFTFTYLRQVMAVGVVWLSLPFYANKKFLYYFLLIVIASLIHNSAAFMIALYFVPLRKWNYGGIIFVMLCLLGLGLIGVGEMYNTIGVMTEFDKITSHADAVEAGFRYEYVIESFFFLFLLFYNYRKISFDKVTLSYLNLYLMFCGLLLFYCKSSDGGRMAWYCIMGIIILLVRFCNTKSNFALRLIICIMLFAQYFRILSLWQEIMCPYKTFFTPGHTGAEWVYEKYEYDRNYDRDKFYNLK